MLLCFQTQLHQQAFCPFQPCQNRPRTKGDLRRWTLCPVTNILLLTIVRNCTRNQDVHRSLIEPQDRSRYRLIIWPTIKGLACKLIAEINYEVACPRHNRRPEICHFEPPIGSKNSHPRPAHPTRTDELGDHSVIKKPPRPITCSSLELFSHSRSGEMIARSISPCSTSLATPAVQATLSRQ